MVPLNEALEIISRQTFTPRGECIPLGEGVGRILAADVVSTIDMPPFSKSAMDGFAIGEGDPAGSFRIVETIAAGSVPNKELAHGQCARIMTGAMLPAGAERVVKKEDAEERDGAMRILTADPKRNVIQRGEDIRAGEKVLERGARLRPAEVAFLASIGIAAIEVSRRPAVAIVVTGSELVEPGRLLAVGKIYNSNSYSLAAQITACGALAGPRRMVADDATAIEAAVREAMAEADMVLISGGVSEGDYDFVPAALKSAGVTLHFERVAVQPGKPTVFGTKGSKVLFGLPGNPVSVFVTFEVFVKPVLLAMMGHEYRPILAAATLQESVKGKRSGRTRFLPMEFREGRARPLPYHGSAHLHALTRANAILAIPPEAGELAAGQTIHVRLL